MLTRKMKPRYKNLIIAFFVLLLAGAAVIWWLFTLKYDDTANLKPEYTVEANVFLKEFGDNLAAANKKYSEKIVAVNGIVSAIEMADTTANVKMIDTSNNAYIIFAFQQQHLGEAKTLTAGERVSIKGSCSNGTFSNILETHYVTFIRSTFNK